ncbi:MAG: hypothetical protein EA402_11735 [Planctomycetota bacterium]|nr:MAG: hypothetical protein EA402_11735 [Planctomycetota bacterium]
MAVLSAAELPEDAKAIDEEPGVVVDGRLWAVNGALRIPDGMFGVHATPTPDERIQEWGISSRRDLIWVPGTKPRTPGNGFSALLPHYIECFWDRYHPALQLTNPGGWREQLQRIGTGYGEAARDTGWTHRVEFWNEPYLNWASRPGVNYDPKFYQRDGVQEGDRVYIRGQKEPTEYLIWRQGHFLLQYPSGNPLDINGYVRGGNFMRDPFSASLMRGAVFNEPFEFQGHRKIARPMLVPYDPTQFERESAGNRWWSGQQNRVWYQEMLLAFGEALKAANPDVQLAAGWGFHFNQGGWAAWRELYRPVLEAAIHIVDAVHEHHYGGDTRMVAANYEVVWNWAKSNYGKSLEFWNTEAGGQLDPQRPDVVAARPQGSRLDRARGGATYTMRDILYLLKWSPDKATARAAHEAHINGGDEFAFRLLRNLRGSLLSTQTLTREVWPVASLTDDGDLVLAVFNDHLEEQEIPVTVISPDGYIFGDQAIWRQIDVREDGEGLMIVEEPQIDVPVGGTEWAQHITVPSKSAKVLTLSLQPKEARMAGVRQLESLQFPALEKLATVNPERPYKTVITIPPEVLANAESAHLRLAMISYSGEGGEISINGQVQPLKLGNWLHRQEIDLRHLLPATELEIRSQEGSFGIWTASIVVERTINLGEGD